MPDIYMDPTTGDIDLTNGKVRLTANKGESVRQRINITLNTNRGEWVYNVAFGIPYFKNEFNPIQLLGKTNTGLLDSFIFDAILSINDVEEITSYESVLDKKERRATITFRATTTSGETVDGESTLQI